MLDFFSINYDGMEGLRGILGVYFTFKDYCGQIYNIPFTFLFNSRKRLILRIQSFNTYLNKLHIIVIA